MFTTHVMAICALAVHAEISSLRGATTTTTTANITPLRMTFEEPEAQNSSENSSVNIDDVLHIRLESSNSGGAGQGGTSCLCIFDIDRTLTGKQGATSQCPGNIVLQGVTDTAYGGGWLTLSHLGQHLHSTFCGSCHIGAITAHPNNRPRLPVHRVVIGCDGGCKVHEASRMAQSLGVPKHRVYMFDDKASNLHPFHGSGMNARQVSCGTREGSHGLCGGKAWEVEMVSGVETCR
eukprot:TRINITY_DN76345_c0_g1_i1.p1 TRINITY_DN76345_c0_g1~~TRINITY_DN76345_c0_g1_i1.p1  ORF type:complete len:235 (-),score=28.64 TRINITY_DN76345_c0_g1_i1:114-818(-)